MRRIIGIVLIAGSVLIAIGMIALAHVTFSTTPVQPTPGQFRWYEFKFSPDWRFFAGAGILFLVGLLCVGKMVQSGPDMLTRDRLLKAERATNVLKYSIEEARKLNHNYVGTEHLLLGLLREQEGVAGQVLMVLGLKLEEVRKEVLNVLAHT
jgi:hypothetical protein